MNVYMGEGGKLYNRKGERFMQLYNPDLMERSGLRLLVAAFTIEVRRGNGPIYLDMRHFTPEQLERMRWILPLPMMMFERAGLVVNNRFVQAIEWVPAAPIARVGYVVEKSLAASLRGLYACGEAVSRQVRIEGITSCATSGAIAGESAADYAGRADEVALDEPEVKRLREFAFGPLQRKEGIEPNQAILAIQEAVFPYDVLFLRHEKRMQKALEKIEDIRDNELPKLIAYDPHYLLIANEARNMALVAEVHLRAAMMRKETRTVLREDYPYEDNQNWLKWIDIKNRNGKVELSTRDVPIDSYPLKPPRDKKLYYMWERARQIGAVRIEKGEMVWA
jgi:succinate dehydrogenase/fumarate reductase flavoprotein subunit